MMKKVGSLTRVSEEIANDPKQSMEQKNLTRKRCSGQIPKGWTPKTAMDIRTGYANDDFVSNMLTIVATQFIVRAPRIVANRYLQRYRYSMGTRNVVKSKRRACKRR